jgi:hypothetical protein
LKGSPAKAFFTEEVDSGETKTAGSYTGRRFERMFLLAKERMVAVHPMTQMLEEEE